MRNPFSRATHVGLALVAMVGVLLSAAPVAAQLSDEDIAALQTRGEKEGWTFTVGHNPVTDIPLEDLCGFVKPPDWQKMARFDPCTPRRDLPAAFDWRTLGGCTVIKDQGSCGSCWAFGTVGPLECNIKIRDGVTVSLSEQWLLSCNSDGWDCGGGFWAHDYHEWKTDPCGGTGAVMGMEFPYFGYEAPCNCPYTHVYLIDDWAYIGNSYSIPPVDSMKQAILDYGPISVGVYANSAMQAYGGGIFNGCSNQTTNHAVVLVGWDDNQGTEGVWIMRNSWGPGWGENGYMRMPYGCSNVGDAACYVNYPGSAPTLNFVYPDGRPQMASPNGTTFRVSVTANTGTPVAGTGVLYWAVDGGSFQSAAMTQIGSNQYEAHLPPADCFAHIDWYVGAQEATIGMLYDPGNAPYDAYSAIVATEFQVLLDDNFETDQGWTVYNGASTGNWERAAPQETQYNAGSWWDPQWVVAQPGNDHSSAGSLCYVTGHLAGSGAGDYDLDGGPSHLTSPVFDLQGSDATVSYWRWYHISTELDDQLVVAVSNNNGGSWVTAETVSNRQTWTYAEWAVSDYVTPTSQVRVRFTVDDSPNNSLVEALIDDFTIQTLVCDPGPQYPLGDMNCDTVVDFEDINPFVTALSGQSIYETAYPDCVWLNADCDQDGDVDFDDISPFVSLLGS